MTPQQSDSGRQCRRPALLEDRPIVSALITPRCPRSLVPLASIGMAVAPGGPITSPSRAMWVARELLCVGEPSAGVLRVPSLSIPAGAVRCPWWRGEYAQDHRECISDPG